MVVLTHHTNRDTNSSMNTGDGHIQSVYSLNSSIPPVFLDDQSVCYVDSSAVVTHDLDTEVRLRNIPVVGEDVIGLMANDGVLTVASSNKITSYGLGVKEANEQKPDFECNVRNCLSVCFSRCNGLMVALESSLENSNDDEGFVTVSLRAWDTNENEIRSKAELGIFKKDITNTSILVAVHPNATSSSIFVAIGTEIFGVNLDADSCCTTSDIQLPYDAEDDIVKSYCWVDHHEQTLALLGTKCGDVIVLEHEEHFRVNSVINKIVSNESIDALVKTKLGFVLGTASGDVCLFSFLRGDNIEARCVKRWLVDSSKLGLESPSITGIAISPSQDKMCIMTSGIHQLHKVLLSPDDDIVIEMLDAGGNSVMPSFLSVTSSCIAQGHGGSITSMDVCIGLPLVITTGSDQTVCIWNYEINRPCVCKYFSEPILSIAIHPSGLHAILGFHDNLKIMNIVHKDLLLAHEVPTKMCRECRFSNGGNLFAAAHGAVVSVYDFYSATKLAGFMGHSGKIQNISWSQDGSGLISCGDDGAVYQWDFECGSAGTRICDMSLKINPVCCVVGNEGTAWILKDQGRSLVHMKLPNIILKEIQYSDSVTLGPLVALSWLGLNAVFIGHIKGNHVGSIRAQIGDEFHDFQCSNKPITKLRISSDNTRMFVSDSSGKVSVLLVNHLLGENASSVTLSPSGRSQVSSNATLINKAELAEYDSNIEEMKGKLRELEMQNQYQMRVKQKNEEEEARDAIENFVQCLVQGESNYALLREEKADMNIDFEEQIQSIKDEQQSSYHNEERLHQSKIVEKIEAYNQVAHEIEDNEKERAAQRSLLVATYEDYQKELENNMAGRLEEAIKERIRLGNEGRTLRAELALINEQVEDDIDTQIELLKDRYEKLLVSEREASIHYSSDIGIMKKKSALLEKSIEDKKEEIQASLELEEGLQKEIHLLHDKIELLEKELKGKEANLERKNVIFQNLGKKSKELETYKFVLDSKIEDLAKLIEPRKAEVRDLKVKVSGVDEAIKVYDESKGELSKNIDEIKQLIVTTQDKMRRRRKQSSYLDSSLHRINSEIYDCSQLIQHPERLKTKIFELQNYINKIVHPFIHPSKEEKVPLGASLFAPQWQELQSDLQEIVTKNKKRANENRKVRSDLIDVNMNLLREISTLRSGTKTAPMVGPVANIQKDRRIFHGN